LVKLIKSERHNTGGAVYYGERQDVELVGVGYIDG